MVWEGEWLGRYDGCRDRLRMVAAVDGRQATNRTKADGGEPRIAHSQKTGEWKCCQDTIASKLNAGDLQTV